VIAKNSSPIPTPDPWLQSKVKESNGDFSKLSSADQARLNTMTHGHGAEAIRAASGAK